MIYNFKYRLFLYLKGFKSNSGLNLIDFYFQQYRITKKKIIKALNGNNEK